MIIWDRPQSRLRHGTYDQFLPIPLLLLNTNLGNHTALLYTLELNNPRIAPLQYALLNIVASALSNYICIVIVLITCIIQFKFNLKYTSLVINPFTRYMYYSLI